MEFAADKKIVGGFRFNLVFIVAMSVVTGLLVDLLIHQFGGGDRGLAPWQSIAIAFIFTVTFYSAFVGVGYLLYERVPLNSIRNLWVYIGVSSVVMVIAFFVAARINEWIFPIVDITSPDSGAFPVVFGISVLSSVVGNAIYYGRDFYHRYMEMERLNHESQMAALKAQIDPHFLFNSLNSVASLIRTDPLKAEAVIEDLSDLYRLSLAVSRQTEMTLNDELEIVEKYLSVECARFGDRLQYELDVEERAKEVLLPGLTLQPLVENCIKHGLTETMGPFKIHLRVVVTGEVLTIEVADNGPGFPPGGVGDAMRNGTGLRNVKERMELRHGRGASLSAEGNTVTLKIPVHERD